MKGQSQQGLALSPPAARLRDLLIKRLAFFGLPTREIVRLTGLSGRTVTRTLQRMGFQRKKPEKRSFPPARKRHVARLGELLIQFDVQKDRIGLDILYYLARENGLSLKEMFDLMRKHFSPSSWAIRSCPSCGRHTATASAADRYCPACKKQIGRACRRMADSAIYE